MRIAILIACAGLAFAAPQSAPPAGAPLPVRTVPIGPAAKPEKPKQTESKQKAAAAPAKAAPRRAEKPAATAPPPPPKPGAYGPGQDVGKGFRACVPGDTMPAGTVKNGYRKFEANTPFGPSCRWEFAPGAPDSPPPAETASTSGPLPGVDVGGGYRGCAASDAAPAGTVQNGYRKVQAQTPFGPSCRWEPVQNGAPAAAAVEFRPCSADDTSPAGTVRDGFRKVEAITSVGKSCRWERTAEPR